MDHLWWQKNRRGRNTFIVFSHPGKGIKWEIDYSLCVRACLPTCVMFLLTANMSNGNSEFSQQPDGTGDTHRLGPENGDAAEITHEGTAVLSWHGCVHCGSSRVFRAEHTAGVTKQFTAMNVSQKTNNRFLVEFPLEHNNPNLTSHLFELFLHWSHRLERRDLSRFNPGQWMWVCWYFSSSSAGLQQQSAVITPLTSCCPCKSTCSLWPLTLSSQAVVSEALRLLNLKTVGETNVFSLQDSTNLVLNFCCRLCHTTAAEGENFPQRVDWKDGWWRLKPTSWRRRNDGSYLCVRAVCVGEWTWFVCLCVHVAELNKLFLGV